MLLEDWYGKRNMVFDNPLNEFLVRVLWFAIVGDGVFQRLAFILYRSVSHFDIGLVIK